MLTLLATICKHATGAYLVGIAELTIAGGSSRVVGDPIATRLHLLATREADAVAPDVVAGVFLDDSRLILVDFL